mgnify:CR=1 FL=1
MTQIIINPGSGPVEGATLENAIENMKHYLTDCGLEKDFRFVHLADKDEDGRFHFIVFEDDWNRGIHHFIDMPGLPLDKVRYVQAKGQNIWNYPRLYIDGSSWVWCFSMLKKDDFDIEKINDEN